MSEIKRQVVDPEDAKVNADHLKINGIFLRGEISPFDIPKELVANYSAESKTFVCELIYLTEEPLKREPITEKEGSKLYFHFGKNSGKLYKIEIENIDREKVPNITIEVELALNHKIEDVKKEENFEDASLILNIMSAKKAIEKTHMFQKFATA
ncbi:hypothetical protein ACES2I_04275 [Bdellovibrio bacteriovorus]|uniref:hypothetical protein n=1 Tax=Bdellovibrio bacteriovorus TaxID=959 RepID=UPI0035A62804